MRTRTARHFVFLFLIAAMLVLLSGCGGTAAIQQTQYKATFLELFDTVSQIIGYDQDKETYTAFAEQTKDALAAYHALYDIYHDDAVTSIKTINDNAGIQPGCG